MRPVRRVDGRLELARILSDNRIIRSSNPLADVPQGSTNLAEDNLPRVFFDGVDEFLFVRNIQANDTTYHIITKRVKVDGEDRDPNMSVIDSAGQGARIVKGGSWDDRGCGVCRPAARHGRPADLQHILIGFRLVRDAPMAPVAPPVR